MKIDTPAPAKRLREFRESKGLSRADLANAVGAHPNQIQKLENGERRITTDWIERLAPHLGRKQSEFLSDGPPDNSAQIIDVHGSEFARIPVYDIRFAAGAGSQNDDERPIDNYLIGLPLLRSMTDAPLIQIAIFQADGDSMEPTIHSRDWVFVDRRKVRLTNPGIYALVFEGDGFLKRAAQHMETGAVTLISDNAKYPPQTIKKPERLIVVGRVFMSIRRH